MTEHAKRARAGSLVRRRRPHAGMEGLVANMSYCRFSNTAKDLRDCLDKMDSTRDLGDDEAEARLRITRMAVEIARDYGHGIRQDRPPSPARR
jgi:hypothetical protein